MPDWISLPVRLSETFRAFPSACALEESGNKSYTYSQVSERASRLGAFLRERGVRPGEVVGLALGRSADFVHALLGCWWAGAVFLPLDPQWPAERLAFLAHEANLRLAFAHKGSLALPGVEILDPAGADRLAPLALPSLAPQDPAYVIYTSGSTGRPKGVLVPHEGLPALLDAQVRAFGLKPGCRALWLLNPVFDASISDVGTALLSGATLCLEPALGPLNPRDLPVCLRERAITHLDLPPALLGVLEPEDFPESIQALIVGGEPSPPAVLRRWARRFRVVNVYGPTEATVCTSLCLCDPDTWDEPLLGEPLPHVRYEVLDEELQPVPPGTPSELVIGGPCLALGYLNRPELTAERFFEREGGRWYRAGDRVLCRPDGAFVFLGRLDRQVKVRGLLIAPEEVEARLREHPAVREAAVVKRPLPGLEGRQGLVAFLEFRPGVECPSLGELRSWMSRSLPDWMVPQRIEHVSTLTRTASGKVDLRALAEGALSPGEERPGIPLSAGVRQVLAEVWRAVLGVGEVDEGASFFEQGGDSLALLQVVTAAQARGVNVPPALIAEGRTLAELAERLERAEGIPPGALPASALRAEAALVAGLSGPARGSLLPSSPGKILLTGATGFLGSWLLRELLGRTQAEVFCLVRADDPREGKGRLERALLGHPDPLPEDFHDRVRAVPGDLARPGLGLDAGTWEGLAGKVDTIYHAGAWVNVVLPCERLRPTNVLGTVELLRWMAAGRAKRLHHVSTLSVFVASDQNTGLLREDDYLESVRWVYGGYAQSKWAAEWLTRSLAGRVGPIAQYRLGLVSGDSRTGGAAPHDFLTLFLRGLARLGCVPEGADDLRLDLTPVDHAARALVQLSLCAAGDRDGATFHLANERGASLAEILEIMEQMGVSLERVSRKDWLVRLEGLSAESAAACLALCRCLPGQADFESYRTMDLFQATGVEFGTEAARPALAGMPPGPVLLPLYVRRALGQVRLPGRQ